jgi:predicted nicotinamide N-methyase
MGLVGATEPGCAVLTPEGEAAGSPGALGRLEARVELARSQAKVADLTLVVPEPADPAGYLHERLARGLGGEELPFWTKLWPASLVLAELAASQPGDGPVLELGAGLGLPGLAAAARGRRVVLTDLDPDALEFSRAAVELNGLEGTARVQALDWRRPPAGLGRFQMVLGAEVLYHPPLFPALADLLAQLLAPGGRAFLSYQERPFAVGFFRLAAGRFSLRSTRRVLRAEGRELAVHLHALALDPGATAGPPPRPKSGRSDAEAA